MVFVIREISCIGCGADPDELCTSFDEYTYFDLISKIKKIFKYKKIKINKETFYLLIPLIIKKMLSCIVNIKLTERKL